MYQTSKYAIRTSEDGDEVKIVQLFEKTFGNYGGYAVRTPEYWRWCCRQRPSVDDEGILVAIEKDTQLIVGYVVAEKTGKILELSYDSRNDAQEVVSLLIDRTMAYLEKIGASSINFVASHQDRIIKKVLEKRGFATKQPPSMFLSVLDFQQLFSLITKSKFDELTKTFNETISITISDAPAWIKSAFSVQISPDKITVTDEIKDASIQLEIDYVTCASILFGTTSPSKAFLRSKLKIKPILKTLTVIQLLNHFQIGADWAFPLSEIG